VLVPGAARRHIGASVGGMDGRGQLFVRVRGLASIRILGIRNACEVKRFRARSCAQGSARGLKFARFYCIYSFTASCIYKNTGKVEEQSFKAIFLD
jgi:hypothetical protein